MSGIIYRPEDPGEDAGDVVACGPSSRNVGHAENLDWTVQFPDQVLWLGEELFYQIQREAAGQGCRILPSIPHFENFTCGEANAFVLAAEAERVFRCSADERVREGARLLWECVRRYLQDPAERIFNIEGP